MDNDTVGNPNIKALATLLLMLFSSSSVGAGLHPTFKCTAREAASSDIDNPRFQPLRAPVDIRVEHYSVVLPRLDDLGRTSVKKLMAYKLPHWIYQMDYEESGGHKVELDELYMNMVEKNSHSVGYLVRTTLTDPNNEYSYIACDGAPDKWFYCSDSIHSRSFTLPSTETGRFTYMQAWGWAFGDGADMIANGRCTPYYD